MNVAWTVIYPPFSKIWSCDKLDLLMFIAMKRSIYIWDLLNDYDNFLRSFRTAIAITEEWLQDPF